MDSMLLDVHDESSLLYKLVKELGKDSALLWIEKALVFYNDSTGNIQRALNKASNIKDPVDTKVVLLQGILEELKILNSKEFVVSQSESKGNMDALRSLDGIDFTNSISMFEED